MRQLVRYAFIIIVINGAAANSADARTWTDVTGRKIDAEYISSNGESVLLKRASDGKEVFVQLERISHADRIYVQSRAQSNPPELKEEIKLPKPPEPGVASRSRQEFYRGISPYSVPPERGLGNARTASFQIIDAIRHENNAAGGSVRPEYRAGSGRILVEIKADLFFPPGNEWNLEDLKLKTKKEITSDLIAISYNTDVGSSDHFSPYYLASTGAVISLREGGKLEPVQGAVTTANRITLSGWPGRGRMPMPILSKLAFEIDRDDSPTVLLHGNERFDVEENHSPQSAQTRDNQKAVLPLPISGVSWKSMEEFEVKQEHGKKVRMKSGKAIHLAPKNDGMVVVQSSHDWSIVKADVPFCFVAESSLINKYRLCYYIFASDAIAWGVNNTVKGWLRPGQLTEDAISVSRTFSGSGAIYIFIDDGQSAEPGKNILSNIVEMRARWE